MLTVIADSNVAHLTDYFNAKSLGCPIELVTMAGRDIDASVIAKHKPDALIIRSVTHVNGALLDNNPSVKFVGSATIGTDHVDIDYLHRQDITFANAAGCSKHSVAQYVITAILNHYPQYWQHPITLGVIGLGNIGSTLTQYAQDLGWRILGYDPFLPASSHNNSHLADVLSQSDVISLHVPLTTQPASPYPTYHMLNEATLKLLKPNALLINSARGQVVSEVALLNALTSHHAADNKRTSFSAVLDVFEHEPTVCATLIEQLCIATPHIAGYTLEGKLRGTQMVFDQFVVHFAQILNVANTRLMDTLLQSNPYSWSHLQAHPHKLADFYDIEQDNRLLTSAIDPKTHSVAGSSFDNLRKTYPLRREWLYDNTNT